MKIKRRYVPVPGYISALLLGGRACPPFLFSLFLAGSGYLEERLKGGEQYFASALGTRLLGLRVEQLVRPLQGGVQHPGSLVGRVGFLGLAEGLLLQCIQHFLPELAEHFEADEPRGYFFYQHGVFVGSQQFVRGQADGVALFFYLAEGFLVRCLSMLIAVEECFEGRADVSRFLPAEVIAVGAQVGVVQS